jgi:hypothetical protein
MHPASKEFPEQRVVFPGSLLGSIAHALFICHYPDFAHAQSWDGMNYNVQDSAGSHGTVAFSGDRFVGVFFYEQSSRNPFRDPSYIDVDRYFFGIPDDLRELAYRKALRYNLEEYNGAPTPVITTAFWGDGVGERLVACEDWASVFLHGACLIQHQLLKPDLALAEWATEYELEPKEMDLVMTLFQRRVASSSLPIPLLESELQLLESFSPTKEGIQASLESLAEIGFVKS